MHQQFLDAGATLIAISPQTVSHNRTFVEERRLSFPVLSDAVNAVARQFALVFEFPEDLRKVYRGFGVSLPDYNGDESWTLPLPARYIIDSESIIRYARIDPDYTTRPEPEETLAALKSATSAFSAGVRSESSSSRS